MSFEENDKMYGYFLQNIGSAQVKQISQWLHKENPTRQKVSEWRTFAGTNISVQAFSYV
jgi:hypothetical protein